jgi:tetratricopeptide (TPR) repeat protein
MENKDWTNGTKLSRERKWDEALAAFERAMEAIDSHPDLIHDRAVAMFNLGRKEEALEELNRAVQLQPDYSYRYSSRAYMKSALKDLHGAIADYKKAIELDPEDAIALNNLGLLEEQLGYSKEAQDRYKVADELMGILKDNQIDSDEDRPKTPPKVKPLTEDQVTRQPRPENAPPLQDRSREIIIEEEKRSLWIEIKAVFTTRGRVKEFFRFIGNGFKLEDPNSQDRDDLSS